MTRMPSRAARNVALVVVLGLAALGGLFTVLAVVVIGIPCWAISVLVRWQRAQRL